MVLSEEGSLPCSVINIFLDIWQFGHLFVIRKMFLSSLWSKYVKPLNKIVIHCSSLRLFINQIVSEMYMKLLIFQLFQPQGELFTMIEKNDHVYIEWLSALDMISDQQYKLTKTCDFAFSKENFFHEHVAMAFPDDSPWIKKFNHEIRLMLQSGLMQKWKKVSCSKNLREYLNCKNL